MSEEEIFQKVEEGERLSVEEKEYLKSIIEREKQTLEAPLDDDDKDFLTSLLAATEDREYIQTNLEENKWGLDSWEKYLTLGQFFNRIELPNEACTEYIQRCLFQDVLHLNSLEKMRLIKDMRIVSGWPEKNYFQFVHSCLRDPSFAFDSFEQAELIQSLADLSMMQKKIDFDDGYDYTSYERYLFSALKEFELDDNHKAHLISQTRNWSFIASCLQNISLSSEKKKSIIMFMQNEPGITREEYYERVLACVQNGEKLDLSPLQCYELINFSKFFQGEEEVKEGEKMTEYAHLVTRALLTKRDMFSPDMTENLIISVNDINLTEVAACTELFPLNMTQKISIIAGTKNQEFIDKLLSESNLDKIGYRAKSNLVMHMAFFNVKEEERADFIKKYLENPSYHFRDADIVNLAYQTKDTTYMKQVVEEHEWQSLKDCVELVVQTKDPAFIKEFLDMNRDRLHLNYQDELIRASEDEEEIAEWNGRIHQMKNIAEIRIEEMERLPDSAMIQFQDESINWVQETLYSKQDMIVMRRKIDELLQGIPPAEKENAQSELNTFLAVYNRLMPIPYDTYAISDEGEKNKELQRKCRCLEFMLEEEPTCVCAGYAELLRNCLALKGIECKYISGLPEKDSMDGHAWNQVKIGENWYNVDLTWDRDKYLELGEAGPEVLKTDQEFEDHQEYSIGRTRSEEECTTSIHNHLANITGKEQVETVDTANLRQESEIMTIEELAGSAKAIAMNQEITYSEVISETKKVRDIEQQEEKSVQGNQIGMEEKE